MIFEIIFTDRIQSIVSRSEVKLNSNNLSFYSYRKILFYSWFINSHALKYESEALLLEFSLLLSNSEAFSLTKGDQSSSIHLQWLKSSKRFLLWSNARNEYFYSVFHFHFIFVEKIWKLAILSHSRAPKRSDGFLLAITLLVTSIHISCTMQASSDFAELSILSLFISCRSEGKRSRLFYPFLPLLEVCSFSFTYIVSSEA